MATPTETPGSWRRVEQIFHEALEQPPGARAEYVHRVCGSDTRLARDVQSLLSEHETDASLLDRPAAASGGTDRQLRPGDSIGPYRIVETLGAGGMGEVYRAHDTRLGRDVALKTLAASAARDRAYLERLRSEARVLASLNHPRIATLHGIEEAGGVFALVMEVVEGRTLAQRLVKRKFGVAESIALGMQIAEALDAAHQKGIVHRDLKPGNVMVTDGGSVKVVDFGLAKRSVAAAPETAGEPTATLTRTAAGVVMGTHGYMSPEQIQGLEVDGRSDIWAFGCVLYRMLTGKEAFLAGSSVETMAAVLAREPVPPRNVAPDIPAPLERLVMRCLRKELSDRWQSMADVRLALEDLKPEIGTAPAEVARPGLRWLPVALALVAGGLLAGGVFWWYGRQAETGPAPVLHMATLDEGLSGWPSLSGDGSLLAFASDRAGDGNLDIWLKQVNGRQAIRLTDDPADDSEPSISPDGTKIAFRSERNGGGVYVVPALGGEAVLIAPGGRSPRFAPDGKSVAFWQGRDAGHMAGSAKVFVVDSGGGTPRQVGASLAAALYPVWSPTGETLLVMGRDNAARPEAESLDWWVLPIDGGTPRKTGILPQLWTSGLLPRRLAAPRPLIWQPGNDGRVTFALQLGDASNLWETGLRPDGAANGAPRRLTLGPGRQISAAWAQSNAGERLAFADAPLNYDIWELPVDASSGAAKGEMAPVQRSPAPEQNPSVDFAGSHLAFISRQAGMFTLQLKDRSRPDAKTATVFTSERFVVNQVISGDGRRILLTNADSDILSQPAAGGVSEELCKHCGTVMGASLDGTRVLYEPLENEDLTYWDSATHSSVKAALRADPATVLSGGRFSPDGKWIAFEEIDNRNATARVWVVRATGPFPVPRDEWIAVTDGAAVERDPAWSPGGGLLYYLSERDGFRCIWARRLSREMRPDGPSFAVKHLHSARWSLMNVGAYGERIGLWAAPGRLIFSLGEVTGNIWLEEMPAAR